MACRSQSLALRVGGGGLLTLLAPLLYPVLCLLLSTSILFFITRPSLSEIGGWAATYGGDNIDWAESIQQTQDGGYIVAGFYGSYSVRYIFDEGWGYWVLKLRSNGTIDWQKAYSGAVAESIQQTHDGGYIVAGVRRSFSAEDKEVHHLCVLKLRPDGTVEWQKTYGGTNWDRSNSIQQTTDGGYVVAGWTSSYGAGDHDFWVLKLGADGTVEWQKTYGGTDRDEAESIWQVGDGGYVVAGWTSSYGIGDYDAWVLKLSSDGTVEWQKTYGGHRIDKANSVQPTGDGGYIVAGGTSSFGSRKNNVWVLKLRPDGTIEWQKTYGGDDSDNAHSIQQTSDGGYIVAGYTKSFGAGDGDFWVLKLRMDGAAEWQKAYGGGERDAAMSVQQTGDGGYIVAGKTASFGLRKMFFDLWVLKLNPDGSTYPSCNYFVMDTSAPGINSNATILDTSASVKDSNASPQDTSVGVTTANVSANFLCPP